MRLAPAVLIDFQKKFPQINRKINADIGGAL